MTGITGTIGTIGTIGLVATLFAPLCVFPAAAGAAAVAAPVPAPTPAAKLPPAVAHEMSDAIVAVNKALGLESWPQHGAQPCVDRGGEGTTAKDVSAADVRRCAEAALGTGFTGVGKSYSLAILMSPVGPITAIAIGAADAAGWGAYSCDPGRKCAPTKMQPGSKWGQRLLDRQKKACADDTAVWLPAAGRVCPPAP
jgi:hypothetical protein